MLDLFTTSMITGMASYSLPLIGMGTAYYFNQRQLRDSGVIILITVLAILVNITMYFLLPNQAAVALGTGFSFFFMVCYVNMFTKWYKTVWTPLVLGFLCLQFVPRSYVAGCDTLSAICLGVVCLYAVVYLVRARFDYRSLFMIGALMYGLIQIPTLLAGQFLTIDEWASVWWLMGLSALLYNVITEIGVILCLKN